MGDDPHEHPLSRREFGKRLGAAAIAARLTDRINGSPTTTAPLSTMPNDSTSSPSGAIASPGDELCAMSAIDLAARIRRKDVSAREVMEAHLARIARVNPKVNAIVTLVPEKALAWAREADERQARGESLGVLHGLPVAHKDLVPTAGIRTT